MRDLSNSVKLADALIAATKYDPHTKSLRHQEIGFLLNFEEVPHAWEKMGLPELLIVKLTNFLCTFV